MRAYNYLTFEDRKNIESLLGDGVPVYEIAEIIGKSPQTVYREIKRNSNEETGEYSAVEAERTYKTKATIRTKSNTKGFKVPWTSKPQLS